MLASTVTRSENEAEESKDWSQSNCIPHPSNHNKRLIISLHVHVHVSETLELQCTECRKNMYNQVTMILPLTGWECAMLPFLVITKLCKVKKREKGTLYEECWLLAGKIRKFHQKNGIKWFPGGISKLLLSWWFAPTFWRLIWIGATVPTPF